jgi:anti-sigma factor RsiW
MSNGTPITEADLHAYVDAVLGPARRAEVEAYLARHPNVARRIHAYEEQQKALRAALLPVTEEPIPPELDLRKLVEAAQMIEERHRFSRQSPWRMAATVLLVFGLGCSSGWFLQGTTQPATAGIAALAQEAADNYVAYGPDHIHPVEFGAADAAPFITWISLRLGSHVSVPDLSASGYRLMGGRLVATVHGPAGLFMYDNDQGTRLMMFVRAMAIQKTTPMRGYSDGQVDGFAWSSRGLGYSLLGTASPEILHPIANEVRRQVNTES